MTLVQADLAAIGIPVEFDTSDGPTYWDKAQNGEYQIGRSGWIADYPIIDNFLYSNLISTSADNYANYNNPAFDAASWRLAPVTDAAKRVEGLRGSRQDRRRGLPGGPGRLLRSPSCRLRASVQLHLQRHGSERLRGLLAAKPAK